MCVGSVHHEKQEKKGFTSWWSWDHFWLRSFGNPFLPLTLVHKGEEAHSTSDMKLQFRTMNLAVIFKNTLFMPFWRQTSTRRVICPSDQFKVFLYSTFYLTFRFAQNKFTQPRNVQSAPIELIIVLKKEMKMRVGGGERRTWCSFTRDPRTSLWSSRCDSTSLRDDE